ncbi:MAG: hypothetical protein AAGB32_01255 [Pseudomonadota bacterium]
MSTVPAWAADVDHSVEATEEGALGDIATYAGDAYEGAKEASKGGLPQFDPTWFASQFFWLAMTFAVLYFFFAKITLPSISGVIENRKNQIDFDLGEAEKLTAEADAVHDAYEENLNKASQKASEVLAKADTKIKEKFEKKSEEFRHKSEKDILAAEARIAETKVKAMGEMNKVVAEVAATAVEKITGSETDTNKIQSIVEKIDNSRTKAKAA